MNQEHIDRLRNPSFALVRRGYDMREVDTFLLRLADWLESDAVAEIGTYAIRRKLELVGKATTQILQTTEEQAETLRRESDVAAAATRQKAKAAAVSAKAKADEYDRATRAKADEYAAGTKAAADEEGRRLVTAATGKANQLVAKGEQRREAIETVITDLQTRRDGLLEELDKLTSAVAGTVREYRGAAAPADERAPQRTGRAPASGRVHA